MCAKPFSKERFVRWGECDPAGVIYTPRVFEYALDTLEEFHTDEDYSYLRLASWPEFHVQRQEKGA